MTSRYRDFRSLSSNCLASPEASCGRRRGRSSSPCSRFEACAGPIMGEARRRHFSSSSFTGCAPRRGAYPEVSVNKWLLTPLHLDIDPAFQEIRNKEKEELKTLNNQFAALIGKVQSLEQHNQVLLTRWNFLKEQDNSLSDLDIKLLYDQYMNRLRLEIRSIDNEKDQLESELEEVLEAMDDVRSKYEDEINKRTGMEFTFTALKKDLDNGFLHRTELDAKLNGLHAWVELMQTIQEQELEELLSQTKDVSIVLGIDNNRYNPDLHKIVEDVRAQYEDLAVRSWEELEALTRSKLNEREVLSVKYGDHLLHDRRVIAEMNIQIQKMRSCIVSLKSQCLHLEDNIKDVGEKGEAALHDAKAKLAKLEEALHNTRQDLAQLVKEYQDLMNIKLALDIEILTYRKLMEGEEISMESPMPAVISRIYSSAPKPISSNSSPTTTSNVATRAQESSTDEMSHAGSHVQRGLSRNQSGGSVGSTGGDFSKSHRNRSVDTASGSLSRSPTGASGGASEAFRSPSTTSGATLDSSRSRSTSSRNENVADAEDNTDSSVSRNLARGSQRSHSSRGGDNPEGSLSRSHSGGTRGISDGSLSRSQSNRSDGLTDSVFIRTHSGASDSVQDVNSSRDESYRSARSSSSSISRTQSRESNTVPIITHPSDSGSERVQDSHALGGDESEYSRSQRSRSRDSADGGFARTPSRESEGVSEGSLYGGYSGSSASYVEGGLSRSQSGENQLHSSAEPVVSRASSAEGGVPEGAMSRTQSRSSRSTLEGSFSRSPSDDSELPGNQDSTGYVELASRSTEDGGVPVGGISRSHSGASEAVSEGDLSRSQSNESEPQGSHGHGGHGEPICRSRSAEDGGVPVGGPFRSQSGVSREVSEASLSGSQRDEHGFHHSYGSEGYSEPSAISRSQSEASQDISGGNLSRSQSGENEFHGTDKSGEPLVSRASSAEEGNVSVGSSISRSSSSSSRASRNHPQASFSGSQSGAFADTVFTRAHTEGIPEGSFSEEPSDAKASFGEGDVARSHSAGERGAPQWSAFRTRSTRSATSTDSVFVRTPGGADGGVHEEATSGTPSGTRGSDPEVNLPEGLRHRSEGFSLSGLSRLQSGAGRGDPGSDQPRRQSSGSKGTSESTFTRSQSKKIRDLTESLFGRTHSGTSEGSGLSRGHSEESEASLESAASRSHSRRSGGFAEPSVSRSHSGESMGHAESLVSRTHSGSRGVPEESLSRSPSDGSEGLEDSSSGLSRGHSNKSIESDIDGGASLASDDKANKVALESSPSRSRGATAESFSRSHSGESGGPVETSTPICPRRRVEGAGSQSLSRSQSGESGSFKAADFYRSSSEISRGASEASLSRHSSRESEPLPEGILSRNYSYRCAVISPSHVTRTESSESEEIPEDGLSRSGSSESGRQSGIYRSQSGGRETIPEGAASRSYRSRSEGGFVERNLSRGQSSGSTASSPACLIREVSSDEYDHSPTDGSSATE